MGIPASLRLRAQRDFQKVRQSGQRLACGPFFVNAWIDPDSTLPARLGVVASRRVGNAVKRNRGKRLVRELFRRNLETLPAGTQLVVVLRSGFDRFQFTELEARFCQALERIQALTNTESPGG